MSERRAKIARSQRAAQKKQESHNRQGMIDKYKPACPDCKTSFTAEQYVNRCKTCSYHVCDACAKLGLHRCKIIPIGG